MIYLLVMMISPRPFSSRFSCQPSPLSLTMIPRVASQEWGNSFRSLYRAFTSGNCAEFYVCSKMFT